MKNYDFKGIISAISEASPSHLALVSFLVLPVILNYWLEAIIKFFPHISEMYKIGAFIFLLVVYVFCILWLLIDNKNRKDLEVKRDRILARLIANNWKVMRFDSARIVLGENTKDEEIVSIIEAFPKILRSARMKRLDKQGEILKDKNGQPLYDPAVGRIRFEE